jgi:hypothetical protein
LVAGRLDRLQRHHRAGRLRPPPAGDREPDRERIALRRGATHNRATAFGERSSTDASGAAPSGGLNRDAPVTRVPPVRIPVAVLAEALQTWGFCFLGAAARQCARQSAACAPIVGLAVLGLVAQAQASPHGLGRAGSAVDRAGRLSTVAAATPSADTPDRRAITASTRRRVRATVLARVRRRLPKGSCRAIPDPAPLLANPVRPVRLGRLAAGARARGCPSASTRATGECTATG